MMNAEIYYVTHKKIDYNKWNNCIEKSLNRQVYAESWYLDIVSPNWDALIWGDYEVVMPITWKKKWGIYYIFQPFWVQQLGVFSPNILGESLLQKFITSIPKKFQYIEQYWNMGNNISCLKGCLSKRKNYILPLDKDYSIIHKGYKKGLKDNIKKAKKAPIHLIQNVSAQQLTDFYRTHLGKKVTQVNETAYQQLKQLVETAIRLEKGQINTMLTDEKEVCAINFLLCNGHRITSLISISSALGRKYRAMPFLLDNTIQKYANTNHIVDFEGSMIPSIATFYRYFGAEVEYYYELHLNRMPNWIGWLKK